MRSFWVKRGEWVIGPVTEHQIRAMARQQWFRSSDEVGIAQEGPWAAARSVIPASGINPEVTQCRESPLEAATPEQPAETRNEPARQNTERASAAELAADSSAGTSVARSEAPPAWFRSRRKNRQPARSDPPSSDLEAHWINDFDRLAGEQDQAPSSNSSSAASTPGTRPAGSDDARANQQPLVDDLFGDPAPISPQSTEPADRFHTAEIETVRGSDSAEIVPEKQGRESASGDWGFDLAAGLAAADEDAVETPTQGHDAAAPAMPDQFELDIDEQSLRKPVTDWELVIDRPDDEDEVSAVPFTPSVHNLKTGKTHSASESAVSAELDFARLARLAAEDPALSRSELPTAGSGEEPAPLATLEERALRRTIGSGSFQTLLSLLCLTIGLQSCALAAVINGLAYVALRRFFLLSTETFFPWGTGSLEVLEGADLALAGTAMAITFALPFLALSYLIRVDGRVLFYLISLGVALLPAIVIGSGGLNAVAGIVFACLLFAVPAVVAAVLCGMLAMKCTEQLLWRLLIGAATAGVLVATSVVFAAPNFNIEYLLRELPPELRLTGGLIYIALLFYSAQLTLLYFVLDRISRACLDESTQRFIQQHMAFHWMLTVTAFVLIGAVHAESATGWGTAPVLLGGLTAVVALGFNLWSLVGHIEPHLDRLRIND